MNEKIQLINFDGKDSSNFKFTETRKIDSFKSFNEFDLTVLDLRNPELFILENRNTTILYSNLCSMYENLSNAILNLSYEMNNLTESKLLVIIPNNFTVVDKRGREFKEIKYELGFLGDVVKKISTLNLIFKFECSTTKIGNEIVNSEFYIDDYCDCDTVIFRSKGNKPVLVSNSYIYVTTLNINFDKNLEILLYESEIIKKENEKEPDWIKDFNFFDDEKQKEKILNSESLIKIEEEKIENSREILQINKKYKSILYTQGEELVDVVKEIISEMLDVNLSGFIDKKIEDIRFEYNNNVFIGEIKGITDNVKSKNLSQLDNHFTAFVDENPNIDEEKIFKLLIINSQRKLPLDKRDSIDNKQIAQAEKKYKSLIIETKTLLKLFEDYKNQKINREEIIEKLKTYGILKL